MHTSYLFQLYLFLLYIKATLQGDDHWKRKRVYVIEENELSHENETIFLGYSHNPFGPSKKITDDKFNKLDLAEILDINGAAADKQQEPRRKRGVVHLYNMVSCATGCNPLIYKGYGCYCGFLGSGHPVDGIDSCCKRHDWCYNNSNCPTFLEYFIPYYWKCHRNRPICAINNGDWGGFGSCSHRLCECDKALSECLSRFPCPRSRAFCRSSPFRLLQNALMIF